MKYLFSYELEPEDSESRFRTEMLSHDKNQIIFISAFVLFIILGFMLVDFNYLQSGTPFLISVSSRVITFVMFILFISLLRKQSDVKKFDRLVFIMVMLNNLHMLIAGLVRPDDYIPIVVWDLVCILFIYTVAPIPLHFQFISASFLTIASTIIWLMVKTTGWIPSETGVIIGTYFFINIYGILQSVRYKRFRRDRFVHLLENRKARLELEKALGEVKELRGIIPICASCKKIKDDKGYWNQVEKYIQERTNALFSHGYCEDCLDKLYSEQEGYYGE